MGLAEFFSFLGGSTNGDESLPEIFPLSCTKNAFVEIDVRAIYKKILTDVVERTQGLKEEDQALLWDNCLMSESKDGLITMLAKAMASRKEIFIVLDKSVGVIRKATSDEEAQIRADYAAKAESKTGTYISFKEFEVTDMITVYSALEYASVASLNKSMNLARALQVKVDKLRESTAASDSADAKAQAKRIATALSKGQDVYLDAKDILELLKPDLTATTSALEMINQKRSFYLGLPASYITGALAKGLGDSGDGDARAVERGLKPYYFSIMKPVLSAVFGVEKLTFRSEDFQQLSTALEALKTFDITSDEHLSGENKTVVINKLFGLDPDTKGDKPEKVETPPVDPNAPPAAGPKPAPAKPDPKAS